MADYHPLDTRYKGPSTAYRGSGHGKSMQGPAPVAPPMPDQQGQSDGPWRTSPKTPPPLPLPGQTATTARHPTSTPPPVPKPARSRAPHRRVLFGALALIIFVLVNSYVSRSLGIMSIDVKDLGETIQRGSGRAPGKTL